MSELIDIFRALADPTRLRVVALLREMELAIGELAAVLDGILGKDTARRRAYEASRNARSLGRAPVDALPKERP